MDAVNSLEKLSLSIREKTTDNFLIAVPREDKFYLTWTLICFNLSRSENTEQGAIWDEWRIYCHPDWPKNLAENYMNDRHLALSI